MYRVPSRRRNKKELERLNLIPILDSVFIFIFFLLMSANFIKVFEINSNIPIVSEAPVPKSMKKPLNLTVEIYSNRIDLLTGIPSRRIKSFSKTGSGEYDFESIHNYLIALKGKYLHERTAIFDPKIDLEYGVLVNLMDAVRMFRTTDQSYYVKDKKTGADIKVNTLFDDIVFGSIKS